MPLSTKQMEYLALAWQCFDSEPKIDYDKFKTVAGLSSAASARELMRVTKKKLKEEYGALSGSIAASNAGGGGGGTPVKKTGGGSSPATPASAAGKRKVRMTPKKAAAEMNCDGLDGNEEDDDEEELTPVKKRSKRTPVKKEPILDESYGELV